MSSHLDLDPRDAVQRERYEWPTLEARGALHGVAMWMSAGSPTRYFASLPAEHGRIVLLADLVQLADLVDAIEREAPAR